MINNYDSTVGSYKILSNLKEAGKSPDPAEKNRK